VCGGLLSRDRPPEDCGVGGEGGQRRGLSKESELVCESLLQVLKTQKKSYNGAKGCKEERKLRKIALKRVK